MRLVGGGYAVPVMKQPPPRSLAASTAALAMPAMLPLAAMVSAATLLLGGCTLLPAVGGGGREIRVMTWNVHHGEGLDGRIDLQRIAREIAAQECDLVALQELDRGTRRSGGEDQLAVLARHTGMHAAFGKAIDYQGGAYGVGVLSRWPIVANHVEELHASRGREPRAALTVRVDVPDHGPLWLACTHLDHGASAADRIAQARALVERVRRTREPGRATPGGTRPRRTSGNSTAAARAPDVLAGDLNDVPDSATLAVLEEVWIDPYGARDPTWPAAEPRRRLDHVLVRHDGGIEPVALRVVPTMASDHRPVVATLRLAPPPP